MLNRLQAVFLSLHRHNVRYLVIGGIAAVVHGVPRATFDLDILIDATFDNAALLLAALRDAELGTEWGSGNWLSIPCALCVLYKKTSLLFPSDLCALVPLC